MNDGVSTARCALVWCAATAGAIGFGWWLVGGAPTAPDGFADGLALGCAVAAALCIGWLWVLVSLVVLDTLGRRATPRRGVPTVVRRLVLAGCGLGLAGGGLVVPAHADPPDAPDAPASAVLVGLPIPDRTTTATQWVALLERRVTDATAAPPERVVVAAGDSLWSIAEETSPGTPSDAEVERRWREIYAANRAAIGADPDLIRPGQRLRLPDPSGRAL